MRLLTPEQMLEQLYERLDRPGALADLARPQQTREPPRWSGATICCQDRRRSC